MNLCKAKDSTALALLIYIVYGMVIKGKTKVTLVDKAVPCRAQLCNTIEKKKKLRMKYIMLLLLAKLTSL